MTTTTAPACAPLYATPRNDARETLGHQVEPLARLLGLTLMPWQRQVLDTALEVDENGDLHYRHVTLTIPRQNGKSTLLMLLVLWRMLMYSDANGPQVVTFAAQNVIEAQAQWLHKFWPSIKDAGGGKLVAAEKLKMYMSIAKPELQAQRSKSIMRILTGAADSGHGMSVDLAVVDEAFSYVDDTREVAALPAMWARPNPQYWVVSTAGTDQSLYLRGKVDDGRARCVSGEFGRTAYFEWGLAEDDAWDSEERWPAALPALGTTVTLDAIREARGVMSEREFRRSALNQWPLLNRRDTVIDWDVWQAAQTKSAGPNDHSTWTLAVDTDAARRRTAIAVSDGHVVELIRVGEGTKWVDESVRWLVTTYPQISRIIVTSPGPFGDLSDVWSRVFLGQAKIETAASTRVGTACSFFAESVEQGECVIRTSAVLDQCLQDADRRVRATGWVWWPADDGLWVAGLTAVSLAWDSSARPRKEVVGVPVAVAGDEDDDFEAWLEQFEADLDDG